MSENKADSDLDPRIQIELDKLNTTTDEINKLELEYDEANTTFHMLLNESTRRLKILSKKLGSSIEKARPYYEALQLAKLAQKECQKAAVEYQRAHEIHAAAKETVALAEQRFMSNQHEWQFDNAWQEMLNHATIKVMEAEHTKSETGREHQRRASIFNAAEEKVKLLEDKYQKSILKARPYFDEKTLCQEQLNTQKERIDSLRHDITKAKALYSQTLKSLEQISNEIHLKRGHDIGERLLIGKREPGVGAEIFQCDIQDYNSELDKCDRRSSCFSATTTNSEQDESDAEDAGKRNGAEGANDEEWVMENAQDKLEHLQLVKECEDLSFRSEINIFVSGEN